MKMLNDKKIFWACLGLVLLRVLLAWGLNLGLNSSAPFSANAMYREHGMEVENHQTVSAMFTHPFSDGVVYEKVGTGTRIIGISGAFVMACFVKPLGAYGLILMDVVFAVLNFWGLTFLLTELGLSTAYAAIGSAIYNTATINKIIGMSTLFSNVGLGLAGILIIVLFFGLVTRKISSQILAAMFLLTAFFLFPYARWISRWDLVRPFLSDPAFFFSAGIIVSLLVKAQMSVRRGIILGFLLAYLLQEGAPFEVEFLFIVTSFILALHFLKYKTKLLKELWPPFRAFVLSLVLGALPFIYQRLHEDFEAARRLGTITVDRFHPKFLPFSFLPTSIHRSIFAISYRQFMIFAALSLGLVLLRRLPLWKIEKENPKYLAIFSALLLLATWLAHPAHWVLLGSMIQSHHFPIYFEEMCGLVLLTTSLKVLNDFDFLGISRKKVWMPLAFICVGLTCFAGAGIEELRNARRQIAILGIEDWSGPSYRGHFAEVVRYFESLPSQGPAVIASLDTQVNEWWSGYYKGLFVFNPDAGHALLSDDELEKRLIAFAAQLNMGDKDFLRLIQRPDVLIYFLGHVKYAVNSTHAFAGKDDYTAEQLKALQGVSPFWNFSVILPKSEGVRLVAEYRHFRESSHHESRRLDYLLIDNKDEILGPLHPDPHHFQEVLKNEDFTVWKTLD
jgi:hypothetical protein